jgi:undecaprenyl diphosphate synthase
MQMLSQLLKQEADNLDKNGIRVLGMGEIYRLPTNVQKSLKDIEERTKDNNEMDLIVALSYGGRQEIVDGINKLIEEKVKNEDNSPITIDDFAKYLYLPEIPDPDLVIRTSGEYRISNFLLWQIAYSELYVTKTLWPDFRENELKKAIEDYMNRERRFGGIA